MAGREDSPKWFAESVAKIREISVQLASDRGPAFYGDEKASKSPEELYGIEAAQEALKGAEFVVEQCRRMIEEWWPGRGGGAHRRKESGS